MGQRFEALDFSRPRGLMLKMGKHYSLSPETPDPRQFVERIVAKSGSNLARTLFLVPAERRFGMKVLYAFCRLVDDVADDLSLPVAERRAVLDTHRRSIRAQVPRESPMAPLLRETLATYRARPEDLEAVVDGMLMDLEPSRYADFPALKRYCYHAASAVGLVSLRILGCSDDSCDEFARRLGIGLQLVNILRDVGEDFIERGRIYLPMDAMAAVGCDEETFRAAAEGARRGEGLPEELRELLRSEGNRAGRILEEVEGLIPSCCRSFLNAPLLMRSVYSRLLKKMERGGFEVFRMRYSLSRWEKLALLGRLLVFGK